MINGKLILIGGSEARSPQDESERPEQAGPNFFGSGVLATVLDEIKGPDSRIVLIPAASEIPDEIISLYQEAFGKLGCRHVEALQITNPAETDRPDHIDALKQADGVFFSGGDQARLVEQLAGSTLLRLLTKRYQSDQLVIAGTSAGAAAMAHHMMEEGEGDESLRKGMATLQTGLGLLPSVIVDTHFAQRGRLPRLTEALLQQPGLLGLGLCIDTGVVVTGGNCLRAIGSGGAFVLDTHHISQTNYRTLNEQEPVSVGNLKLHILAPGARYRLDTRQFISPPESAFTKNSL